MGQRSLLVIGYQTYSHNGFKEADETTRHRIARHFQWNWGAFMIRRATQVASLMNATGTDKYYRMDAKNHALGAAVTFCVNQETGNVQGLSSVEDEAMHRIADHDNNNGAFLLDIDADGGWTFGFLIGPENGGDLKTIATTAEYLNASGDSVAHFRAHECHERADSLAHSLAVLQEFERGGHAMNQATADRLAQPISSRKKAEALI